MTKASLDSYCRNKDIVINLHFGVDYSKGEKKDLQRELDINFMDLATPIEELVNR